MILGTNGWKYSKKNKNHILNFVALLKHSGSGAYGKPDSQSAGLLRQKYVAHIAVNLQLHSLGAAAACWQQKESVSRVAAAAADS